MGKPLSKNLRGQVIEAIEGGASRRAAAERIPVLIKWLQCWFRKRNAAA
jgi:transposase